MGIGKCDRYAVFLGKAKFLYREDPRGMAIESRVWTGNFGFLLSQEPFAAFRTTTRDLGLRFAPLRFTPYHMSMAEDQYLQPYRESATKHGHSFEVTLWANHQSQVRRFNIFSQMVHLPGKRILDAGCSRGDLAAFLVERKIAYASYVGIDGLHEVIAFASDRQLPRTRFIAGDFLLNPGLLTTGDPQVICISGSLNTMTQGQLFASLEAAWAATTQTLLFNFLTDLALPAAPHQTKPALRHDGLHLIKWATSQTGNVTYRQDYFDHGHDATIMMVKA